MELVDDSCVVVILSATEPANTALRDGAEDVRLTGFTEELLIRQDQPWTQEASFLLNNE